VSRFNLDTKDAVLLIIDIQGKLVKVMKYGKQVIDKTNILISASEELKFPIIYTEQYPKGLGGTVPELQEGLKTAKKFEKVNFSAYLEEIKKELENTGRKKIIITGMETHVCVFQTAKDLIENGYDVFIVSDGVCSRTKENHKNGLSLMRDMGAVITNTETVVFDLLKKAGTPEFKVISKLIK
jgi:isochorismate hydrolase